MTPPMISADDRRAERVEQPFDDAADAARWPATDAAMPWTDAG